MRYAPRISVVLIFKGTHRLRYERVDARRGVIVEINRDMHKAARLQRNRLKNQRRIIEKEP